jgi:hypothetical protein
MESHLMTCVSRWQLAHRQAVKNHQMPETASVVGMLGVISGVGHQRLQMQAPAGAGRELSAGLSEETARLGVEQAVRAVGLDFCSKVSCGGA